MRRNWSQWLYEQCRRGVHGPRRPRCSVRARLGVDLLEDRCLLTHTAGHIAPVAVADRLVTEEDHALEIQPATLLANDTGTGLTAELVSQPANGEVLTLQGGAFLYIPRPGFKGSDTFTYRVSSEGQLSAPATVFMEVFPLGTAPTPGVNTPITGGNNSAATLQSATVRIVRGPTMAATTGRRLNGIVARIASTAPARSVRALINWGDGTTSRGTVVGSRGQLRVLGNHIYRSSGPRRVLVTLQTGVGQLIQSQGRVVVRGSAAGQSGNQVIGLRVAPLTGSAGSGRQQRIAQFTLTGGRAASFRALIDWGDGRATAGKVVRIRGNRFAIVASHAYALPGLYPVELTLLTPSGTIRRAAATARITAV